jgi:hypothetical protein
VRKVLPAASIPGERRMLERVDQESFLDGEANERSFRK